MTLGTMGQNTRILLPLLVGIGCAPVARHSHHQAWRTQAAQEESERHPEVTPAPQPRPAPVVRATPTPDPPPAPVKKAPVAPTTTPVETTPPTPPEGDPENEEPDSAWTHAGDLTAFTPQEIDGLKARSGRFRQLLARYQRCQAKAERRVRQYTNVREKLEQTPPHQKRTVGRLKKREYELEQSVNRQYARCARIEEKATDMLRAHAANI